MNWFARILIDGKVHATLDEEPRWHCDDPLDQDFLDFGLETADRSPGMGYWLRSHVQDMAELFSGTAEFREPIPDEPPGLIY
jgi:hypothetical protein